ncbi:hypothetical protein MY494_04660 [Synechococcus sp. A10-1-5-1]|uniref:hypothetical protein n=1 Tax=Synechococcus sp. A10-1-5-1 TaxID=2936507 RepID=UPI0020010ED4|nr:hypothetical protein [Synechococcus sp. A10-1-5-1]UPM51066.1 hypothetical protein MY494_04660 [Synechococcus sp. A10-1-5-1]
MRERLAVYEELEMSSNETLGVFRCTEGVLGSKPLMTSISQAYDPLLLAWTIKKPDAKKRPAKGIK